MDIDIIDRYRKIQNGYDSVSKKETDLYELKRQIASRFSASIDYEPNTTIDGDTQKLIVIRTKDEFEKTIIAYPEESFNIGSIVQCYGVYWLITSSDSNKQIYTIGKMIQCNLLLRWQNKSGQIITRWCVAENATKYSSGIINGKLITQPELQFNIKLPLDNETKNLRRDKRFLDSVEDIDGNPTAYKLTQRDTISNNYGEGNRILNITLTEDVFNPDADNKELLIADYFSPTPQSIGQAEISFTGNPTMYVGGSWKYFSAIFKDEDGEIIPDVIPVWSFVSLSSQTDKFVAESLVDGRFRIKALFETSLIGAKIKILLDDTDELYHAEQIVEVIDL